tara:strand:+ start:101 stop:691 length:591 start_codon:yes stop_codon:yes gene_type:complete
MAISYPLATPTTIGIESIELTAMNATATSQSPFTYKQQVVAHTGQRWEANVNIPSVRRDKAAEWKSMLIGLKGQVGTFLLGDPDYVSPRGTVSACSVTGSAGDDTVTVVMTGSLLAGDYIQLGGGSSAKLHTVLMDQTGNGSLEIWPALRSDYTSELAITDSPQGVFRLKNPLTTWSINNASFYGISFEAVEVITG